MRGPPGDGRDAGFLQRVAGYGGHVDAAFLHLPCLYLLCDVPIEGRPGRRIGDRFVNETPAAEAAAYFSFGEFDCKTRKSAAVYKQQKNLRGGFIRTRVIRSPTAATRRIKKNFLPRYLANDFAQTHCAWAALRRRGGRPQSRPS
jgi:hypothetical protein